MNRTTRPLVAATLALLASATASATPSFPSVLKSELALAADPSCNACHVGVFARGTVTTPLGKALTSRGMVAYDEAKLKAAIAALLAARDPSILALKGGEPSDVVAPEYGCACAVAGAPSRTPFAGGAAALVVGIAALMRGRRGRR
jgi:MYXO-CTERM domain-containing protein